MWEENIVDRIREEYLNDLADFIEVLEGAGIHNVNMLWTKIVRVVVVISARFGLHQVINR